MEKPTIPTLEQISAGGVAFRADRSKIEVAIVAVNPSGRWQLPKGLIDAGETEERAALREVREEAGVDCELVEKIETVEYWYVANHQGGRVRFHKFVHFFLMRFVAGDVKDHDREISEARWVTPAEAVEMLAFKSERDVVRKAEKLLEKPERAG